MSNKTSSSVPRRLSPDVPQHPPGLSLRDGYAGPRRASDGTQVTTAGALRPLPVPPTVSLWTEKLAGTASGRMARTKDTFDPQTFFDSAGLSRETVDFGGNEVIFSQGDVGDSVMFIKHGNVKLSVVSKTGKEAVVALLGPGDFFGEGCLAGQPLRVGSATAITPSEVLVIDKARMVQALREQPAMSNCFITHMLSRNVRIEQDLIDQLINSSEKRLARALFLLARCDQQDKPRQVVAKISQETLSGMVGTTRSRVNFFMNKFKKRGFVNYGGGLDAGIQINSSLLSVLHD